MFEICEIWSKLIKWNNRKIVQLKEKVMILDAHLSTIMKQSMKWCYWKSHFNGCGFSRDIFFNLYSVCTFIFRWIWMRSMWSRYGICCVMPSKRSKRKTIPASRLRNYIEMHTPWFCINMANVYTWALRKLSRAIWKNR